ncbi:DNA-binding transcriptional regulator, FadR family [Yoonia tamlensis]|uniref:DNA-binding transcriptional regulator, FadR family n=1 Tax=Yoonia tamlensis TaxID=390270 RepID=A0A1I6HDV8_9RHOB|nr:FadR/GntR family transcriptional regulator [Yoonia tamlensis]SFR52561.1 DNA-binding transcriptional regulator, FadR family [Yoonia tamlensis]
MPQTAQPGQKRILRRNLSEQVAEQIGTRILGGHYRPGDTLPEESQLCSEFGVSRTVIREAVRMLVSKGMLEVRPRIGTRVLNPQDWQLLDRAVLEWQQSIQSDGQQLKDLIELRQAIEPQAAFLAAQRRTTADLQEIGDALRKMEQTVADNSAYAVADAQFHIAILRAAKNRYFDALEAAIFTGLLLSIRVTNPDETRNCLSVPLHQDIASAIIASDPNAAEQAMRVHLADSAARLVRNLPATA